MSDHRETPVPMVRRVSMEPMALPVLTDCRVRMAILVWRVLMAQMAFRVLMDFPASMGCPVSTVRPVRMVYPALTACRENPVRPVRMGCLLTKCGLPTVDLVTNPHSLHRLSDRKVIRVRLVLMACPARMVRLAQTALPVLRVLTGPQGPLVIPAPLARPHMLRLSQAGTLARKRHSTRIWHR